MASRTSDRHRHAGREVGGRRLNDKEVARRRADVEEALERGDWTSRERARLMKKWRVSDRQLRLDRAHVLEGWVKDAREGTASDRIRLARQQQYVYRNAAKAAEWQASSRALREEALLLGAHAPRQLAVEHHGAVDITVRGAEAVLADPLSHARAILDPANVTWARTVLAAAGEAIPGVLTLSDAQGRVGDAVEAETVALGSAP